MKRKLALRITVLIAAIAMLGLVSWLLIYALQGQQFDGNLQKIIALLALPDQAKPEQRFDAVRQFIHNNSRHVEDEGFRTLLGQNLVAEGLVAYAVGKKSEPIHLLCGGRSNMMSAILRKLGYETRIIALFDTDHEQLRAHTFLEVKNPETGRWETQDPDFDLYWTNKRSGKRVSLADSADDLSDLEPCHRPGACGWKLNDSEGKSALVIRDYLDIICVTNEVNGDRFCQFTTRAKPDGIFEWHGKRGRFCSLMPDRCARGFLPVSETLAG
jgi:hypothetical protein